MPDDFERDNNMDIIGDSSRKMQIAYSLYTLYANLVQATIIGICGSAYLHGAVVQEQ